eukprot:GHVU01196070.1.p1 GENE.GHVU01196070.1~~GHVU01196070.1.p1  ORF type:complete len:158 (+),score=11.09 GHVU01196070.1:143-616(+)
MGVNAVCIIINTTLILVNCISLIPSLGVQPLSFLLFVAFTDDALQFLYTFVAYHFSFTHFGVIVGACCTLAGIVNISAIWIDYFVVDVMDKQMWPVNLAFVTIGLSMYGLVYLIFHYSDERSYPLHRIPDIVSEGEEARWEDRTTATELKETTSTSL